MTTVAAVSDSFSNGLRTESKPIVLPGIVETEGKNTKINDLKPARSDSSSSVKNSKEQQKQQGLLHIIDQVLEKNMKGTNEVGWVKVSTFHGHTADAYMKLINTAAAKRGLDFYYEQSEDTLFIRLMGQSPHKQAVEKMISVVYQLHGLHANTGENFQRDGFKTDIDVAAYRNPDEAERGVSQKEKEMPSVWTEVLHYTDNEDVQRTVEKFSTVDKLLEKNPQTAFIVFAIQDLENIRNAVHNDDRNQWWKTDLVDRRYTRAKRCSSFAEAKTFPQVAKGEAKPVLIRVWPAKNTNRSKLECDFHSGNWDRVYTREYSEICLGAGFEQKPFKVYGIDLLFPKKKMTYCIDLKLGGSQQLLMEALRFRGTLEQSNQNFAQVSLCLPSFRPFAEAVKKLLMPIQDDENSGAKGTSGSQEDAEEDQNVMPDLVSNQQQTAKKQRTK